MSVRGPNTGSEIDSEVQTSAISSVILHWVSFTPFWLARVAARAQAVSGLIIASLAAARALRSAALFTRWRATRTEPSVANAVATAIRRPMRATPQSVAEPFSLVLMGTSSPAGLVCLWLWGISGLGVGDSRGGYLYCGQ